MKAFHRAGLCVAGLVVLAGAACLIGSGGAVAQSDLEMPADPPVLSKPYRSTVPIFRRRPPPDAVPPEAGQPASTWREPPGRIDTRDAAAPDTPATLRDPSQDSGFGPVKAAPARDIAPHDLAPRDLAPEDEPDERPAARPGRTLPPPKPETRVERAPGPRETVRTAEPDEAEAAPAYAGVWGPSAAACASRRSARRGFLPAVIRPTGARAGKTLCQFRDVHREARSNGKSWVMTASCQSAGRRWTSRVRLSVAGSRLTWASERGSATYTRCSGG